MSVQRIVEDSPAIELQAEAQHTSGEIETPVIKAFITSESKLNLFKMKIHYFSLGLY